MCSQQRLGLALLLETQANDRAIQQTVSERRILVGQRASKAVVPAVAKTYDLGQQDLLPPFCDQ
jgi:hypothetical protein